MNGNLWYEVARQRVADGQRSARQAGQAREAREARAAARTRRARDKAQEASVAPVIPDYAHEMFAGLGDAVTAPRHDDERGRQTRAGR
jgi:hypothetical protein